MRSNLKVPFPEKDAAKKLGARWDAGRKIWYVQDIEDLTPFAKWSPTPDIGAPAAPARPPATARQSAGVRVIGTRYVAVTPVCACPPWEVCEACRGSAICLENAYG